ncbi:snoRNA-binding rRNA-processing protein utp10, partial [Coemansia sp. RSA 2681]
ETATTLYLSITHADAGIRLVAAKALRDIVAGARTDVVLARDEASGLLVDRLAHDDSEAVLDVVLSLPLASLVGAQALVPALVSVIEGERVPIARLCPKVLGSLLAIDATDAQVYAQVVAALFPYLLWGAAASEAVTLAVHAALPGSAFGRREGGWLSALAAGSSRLDDGGPAKFNRNVARALAAALVAQWPAQAGAWAAQLASASLMARTAAIAVGAHAVALLAKDADRCVAAAALVVDAALRVLLDAGAAGALSEDVLLASVDGSAWAALLGGLAGAQGGAAAARVAGGALSATLGVLASAVRLQPNMWFAAPAAAAGGDGGAEARYRSLLRAAFGAIAARPGKLSSSDGLLIGRVLALGMGDEWAQFLASTWVAEAAGGDALARARSLLSFQALLRHKAAAAAAAEQTDYQTVLPAVVVALGDDDARVRAAAVACVKALHALYPAEAAAAAAASEKKKKHASSSRKSAGAQQTIYRYDVFYGAAASDRLQYLPTATVARFVAMLASRADAMAGDAWTIRSELELILNRGVCSGSGSGSSSSAQEAPLKLASQARSSVAAFFLSHVEAADGSGGGALASFQARLLRALERVVAPAAVLAQLFPLVGAHCDVLRRSVGAPREGSAEDVLVRALVRACFSDANAAQLAAQPGCWQALLGFAAGLDAAPAATGEWGCEARAAAYMQHVALERLADAGGLAAAVGAEAVAGVTACLLRVAARGTAYLAPAEVRQVALRDVYARVALDAATAADELSEIAARLALDDAPPAGKRARGAQAPAPAAAAVLPELGSLLEYMQCSPALAQSPALVPALFALLAVFVSDAHTTATAAASSSEHSKQLVLAMLTRICEEANAAGVAIAESFMRVDVIVQVIRT